MSAIRNPGFLWIVGAANLVFSAVGMFAAAGIIGIPIMFGARALGASADQSLQWLLYSAVIWAPLGSGAGLATCTVLLRGIMRKPPENPKAEQV